MPLFGYHCTACGEDYEMLVFGSEPPTCPKCGSHASERALSRPAPPPQQSDPAPMCQACGQFGTCPGHAA